MNVGGELKKRAFFFRERCKFFIRRANNWRFLSKFAKHCSKLEAVVYPIRIEAAFSYCSIP